MQSKRRHLFKWGFVFSAFTSVPWLAAQEASSLSQLKSGYAARIKRLLSSGALPYIDIESSCNPNKIEIDSLARKIDELQIGLMAMSADPTGRQFSEGVRYDSLNERLISKYPDRFIPVGNGGQPPFLTQAPDEVLAAHVAVAQREPLLLLGEYEVRHYPSPRQVKRGEMDRDVDLPIDGPTGHKIFALSERLGIPFQLHYEVEDALLPPLERMLAQYPRSKVIWCHVGQVRYAERTTAYNPSYVEGLIKRFPHLFFDTAFGDANSTYPISRQRHSRVWASLDALRDDWLDLFVSHPERFLSALDLGGDRMDQIDEYDRKHRDFLARLPQRTQHQIA
ncbi:MAG: amidohydrolase, partial [Betaproteobacteria bacterium]|nr:amidohydrolase [Betaproteobacteria bacterium]